MFHNSLGWKRLIFLCAYLGASLTILLAAMPLSTVHAQAGDDAIFQVKVLIITMFPPERDAWRTPVENWPEVSGPIGPSGDQDGAVYCHTESPNGPCDGFTSQ